MRADEAYQYELERRTYWRTLNRSERVLVLDVTRPGWRQRFADSYAAIAHYEPDFDTIWPILQAHDEETRATNSQRMAG